VSLRYRLADGTPTTVAAFVGTDTLIASVLRVVATRGLVVELEAAPVAVVPVAGAAGAPSAARRTMATHTADLIKLSTHPVSSHFLHPASL
jgi:hypothetical protein